jgi:hypothetical protein
MKKIRNKKNASVLTRGVTKIMKLAKPYLKTYLIESAVSINLLYPKPRISIEGFMSILATNGISFIWYSMPIMPSMPKIGPPVCFLSHHLLL